RAAHRPAGKIAADVRRHPADRGLEQRRRDMAALPANVAAVERRQNTHRGPHAGALVDDRDADAHRLAAIDAGHAHDAAMRLHQRVVAGTFAQRTRAAIGAEVAVDQCGLLGAQCFGAEAELVDRARAHVLDHHVGVIEDEILQTRGRDAVAQIQREAALVVIEHVEQRRGAVREGRTPVARVVALAGRLHLYDVGTEIGEDRGRIRPGDAVTELDDRDAGERQSRGLCCLGVSFHCGRTLKNIPRGVKDMSETAEPSESPWATSLRGFAARFGDRVAVASRGRTLSYAQLAAQAFAVRAAVTEAGAKPGEPVAIVARNGPGAVAASYGVMASGAAEFVVDLNLGPDDVAYAMRILGIRLAVAERGGMA